MGVQRKERLVALAALVLFGALLGLTAFLQAPPPPLAAPEAQDVLPWSALRPRSTGGDRAPGVDLASLRDSDPRAAGILRRMREEADAAPLADWLDGTQVALAGYVVPLDGTARGVTEFLLVPHFGACIHTPPPPSNQVVHVIVSEGAALRTMDRVVARGRLEVARTSFSVATSGYRIGDAQLEFHERGGRTGTRVHRRGGI